VVRGVAAHARPILGDRDRALAALTLDTLPSFRHRPRRLNDVSGGPRRQMRTLSQIAENGPGASHPIVPSEVWRGRDCSVRQA
jgi:hypothetical protein